MPSVDAIPRAEVRGLLDREAIRDQVVRFCRGSDRLDRDLVQSCLPPDAVDDHGICRGPARDYFDANMDARLRVRVQHHHFGQIDVRLAGDAATAET